MTDLVKLFILKICLDMGTYGTADSDLLVNPFWPFFNRSFFEKEDFVLVKYQLTNYSESNPKKYETLKYYVELDRNLIPKQLEIWFELDHYFLSRKSRSFFVMNLRSKCME